MEFAVVAIDRRDYGEGAFMIRNEILVIGLLIALAAGLLAHAFFPRYDWRTVEHNGSVSVIIYDRWSGRFQRAVYADNGNLNVMSVFTPF